MATLPTDDTGRTWIRGRSGAVLLIVVAVGLAVAGIVTAEFVGVTTWPGLALGLFLPMPIIFGLSALGPWLARRSKPTALRLGSEPAFVAPPEYLLLGGTAAQQLTLTVFVTNLELRMLEPDQGSALLALIVIGLLVAVGVFGLSLLWVVAIFRDGIRLELRPESLLVVTLLGRQEVPWQAIAVGPLLRPGSWDASPIGIGRRDLVRTSGLIKVFPQVSLPLHQLGVQPAFLTNAIKHYLLHPEHRAAIGTLEEHDRLQRAMAVYTA
ncbi:hypothetical protein AB0J90_05895 [Micromonospora sp. NPDC049523]|uniref:hypothetical protein n=1 Tax=Micromonospora sp. NPDC049523 TaxID=3155921 RepID=UPI00343F952B